MEVQEGAAKIDLDNPLSRGERVGGEGDAHILGNGDLGDAAPSFGHQAARGEEGQQEDRDASCP
jgi:hypothetical protein